MYTKEELLEQNKGNLLGILKDLVSDKSKNWGKENYIDSILALQGNTTFEPGVYISSEDGVTYKVVITRTKIDKEEQIQVLDKQIQKHQDIILVLEQDKLLYS